jgi:hypothetical protein
MNDLYKRYLEKEKKIAISITIDRSLYEVLLKEKINVSSFINDLLKQRLQTLKGEK